MSKEGCQQTIISKRTNLPILKSLILHLKINSLFVNILQIPQLTVLDQVKLNDEQISVVSFVITLFILSSYSKKILQS